MINKYKIPNLPVPVKQGLYDPSFEHSACGVGLVANVDGSKSHRVIDQGLEVLINLGHRGASGADPDTGDGAGIMVQIPHKFFDQECKKSKIDLPLPGKYGVGTVFLPTDSAKRSLCEDIVNHIVVEEDLQFLGWRDVPVRPELIGTLASRNQPVIRQFFVSKTDSNTDVLQLETRLYIIRKQIEQAVLRSGIELGPEFYICSLSSKKIVYKGLVLANQIEKFYPDLSDDSMVSAFAMVHSRFSTNTLGTWELAHPYRYLIHNGEINTLRGNINWMNAREGRFESSILKDEVDKIIPVINGLQSDTASLDNAVELLMATGRSLPHTMMMLIPEAWSDKVPMDKAKKDFYEYHSMLMEPWDGPALVISTDGEKICAVLDRNGLRPCRYTVTKSGLLVMASETGVLDIPEEDVLYKWRIQPGRMFLLDTEQGRIIEDEEIKRDISTQRPYGKWLDKKRIFIDEIPEHSNSQHVYLPNIAELQKAFGYTEEDIKIILEPMAADGVEAVGSMGNDTPLAVLSDQSPLLFGYFKQLFAQVSNPPLDGIREELVTSVETFIGSEGNLFEETVDQCNQLKLNEPVLTNGDLEKIRNIRVGNIKTKTLSTIFQPQDGLGALDEAMGSLCQDAVKAIEEGYSILVLSDRGVNSSNVPIPSLLATSGVHHHLIRHGVRTRVSIVVESGEPRDVSHFALLFGYGASAVNAYLALSTLNEIVNYTGVDDLTYLDAERAFVKAIHKGVVKVMSKMGISTLQSYRGAQVFEAVGLNQQFIDKYFTWTPSRIGGIGIEEIESESLSRHSFAYSDMNSSSVQKLKSGGQYQWRNDGEFHMWNPDSIASLQYASKSNDISSFEDFSSQVNSANRHNCTIRGLLDFKLNQTPVEIEEVEPAKDIVKRFATGAASLGSISREAHETMAIAMNRIGARSNTGEGGEDSSRYVIDENGDSRNSAMKQVASGRFGVTANYLTNATDLQIKMAQGSKPGEGGQLPGHKVDEYIGGVRNSTPGVELISPPPHHDIYSIEDLAQLIHDLKNSNPSARIHVKLVAEAGVGTIAAGVSKGHGDVVLISGDSGGTGASPESSIKSAGLPWELGVAETQQVLVMNDLRSRIVVQTDGQLKTGRDVAIACLLGAEEFGFATAPLIVMGCIMLRKCHLNTCSVGIATQDPELRSKFNGKPEHVINYLFFVAEELRQIMAELGFRKVDDMVGRMDMLDTREAISHWKAKGLDLSNVIEMPKVPREVSMYHCEDQNHGLEDALDHIFVERSIDALENKSTVQINCDIKNSNRSVGAILSHEITKRYGDQGLPEDTISINLSGSAGQSFGAFLTRGVSINLEGDANDYVGKGLSGGKIVVTASKKCDFVPEENIIIGNVALYGATGGKVFIGGIAGERFAVRNSGAEAVVEGVGDHGCEYMTRGKVVILGPTGRNFAAGMSGGEAYVLDEESKFRSLCNLEMVDLEPVINDKDCGDLRQLLEAHYSYTGSSNARRVLDSWNDMVTKFVKVMPRDYKRVLGQQTRLSDIDPK